MKQYGVRSRAAHAFYAIGMPALAVVAGAFWIWIVAFKSEQGAPVWFGVVWLGLVLVASYRWLKLPFRIEVLGDGEIDFVGYVGRTTVLVQDMVAIKQSAFSSGYVTIKYRQGKLLLMQQFTGFHEFLADVKEANPDVEIVGC